jgi:hypothetical protein
MAMAMVVSPAEVLLGQFFKKRRSLALSLAKCGASIGNIAVPPLIRSVLDSGLELTCRCALALVNSGLELTCTSTLALVDLGLDLTCRCALALVDLGLELKSVDVLWLGRELVHS